MDTSADQPPSRSSATSSGADPLRSWGESQGNTSGSESGGRSRRRGSLLFSYRCPVCGHGDQARLASEAPRVAVRCPNCTTALEMMPGAAGSESASVRVALDGGGGERSQ